MDLIDLTPLIALFLQFPGNSHHFVTTCVYHDKAR